MFSKMRLVFAPAVLCTLCLSVQAIDAATVFMGNGVKIGEVTHSTGSIWVRLTSLPKVRRDGAEFLTPGFETTPDGDKVDAAQASPSRGYCQQVPSGLSLADMRTAMPGSPGQVRLSHWPVGSPATIALSEWVSVDRNRDFTHQFVLDSLQPNTLYAFRVQGRASPQSAISAALQSRFQTAPADHHTDTDVTFTVVTGQSWNTRDDERGQKIYAAMQRLEPRFFVHTGDIVYYDRIDPWVTHVDLARFKWNRTYAQPRLRAFHNRVPTYFIKDDHDSWQNDCWPTQENNRVGLFTWEQGRDIFLEQVPMGDRTYRTVRWGRDLQIWLVEGRDYRSPNDAPDGPAKTLWGDAQHAWFRQTMASSDATFRILISPTPILGPDHLWKEGTSDNHVASRRSHEGNQLRDFLGRQPNLFIVCGDRHWQYVSVDPSRGLREYSCGPTTDAHATTLENPDRRLIKYLGEHGGFLSVHVSRHEGQPIIYFRHHFVSGEIAHLDRLTAQPVSR